MLDEWIESRIAKEERRVGETLDYLKYVWRVSRPTYFRYRRLSRFADSFRHLPALAWHVAAIQTTLHDGCSDCVQIEINRARAAGVSGDTINAVLGGRLGELGDDVCDVLRFTRAILCNDSAQDEYRRRIVERFGDEGLVELSVRISASRVAPLTVRALGFAAHCPVYDVGSSDCFIMGSSQFRNQGDS